MIILLLCVIAAGVAVCALLIAISLVRNRLLERVVEVQMKALGDTHLQGFEALTLSLNRLEGRVEQVEQQIAAVGWSHFTNPPDHGPP